MANVAPADLSAVGHVLFDFFGTLVHYSPSRTEQGYERSFALLREAGTRLDYAGFLSLWSEVSAAFDAKAEASLREFSMADLADAFLRRAVPHPTGRLARRFIDTYLAEWNRGVRDLEGLPALLEAASQRYPLAIVTNTHDAELVPAHLARMGVAHLFEHVVTSVGLGPRKPDPAIFRHAVDALGTVPERCLYVGDSYDADYRGATSAGLHALLVDPSRAAPVDPADRLGTIFELGDRLGLGGEPPPLTVRRFARDEWRLYRRLRLRALADTPDAFARTHAEEADRPDTEWQRLLALSIDAPERLSMLAERGSRPAGLAYGEIEAGSGGVAHLYSMWVEPALRRGGAGRALVEAVAGWARERGATSLVLRVADGNAAARRLYEATGFAATGESAPLRPGSALRAHTLRRIL